MIKRYCISLVFVVYCVNALAQNMQLLYDFDQLPQNLLLNPGTEVDYDKHFGVPLLSNLYLDFGSSNKNVSYNSLIKEGEDNSDALRNLYDLGLTPGEVFVFNQQIEVFSGGIRLNNPKYYLSFGMYQQIDGFSAYPTDFVTLFLNGDDPNRDGRPLFDERYSASHVNTAVQMLGVFHIGLNKKVNEKVTLGARLKILSGSFGLETSSNQGTYYLGLDRLSTEPYIHNFENMNVRLNTSGLLNPFDLSSDLGEPAELVSDLFFMSGSLGLAADFGFSYQLNENIKITGSLLDIGMTRFNHKLTTVEFEDAVIATEDYYLPFEGNEKDYWQSLNVLGEIPLESSEKEYVHYRAPKVNASVRYDMKRKVKAENSVFRNVRADMASDFLTSSFGVQVFTEFRPGVPLWAITGFYSRELTRFLNTKVTYTIDRFSATNLGLGASVHVKAFNFYVALDNLLALPDSKNSNYQSFQVGMNFIFN